MKYFLRRILTLNSGSVNTRFSDSTGYKSVNSNIYAIQPNFLASVNQKYYITNEITEDYAKAKAEEGKPVKYAADGK